MDVLVKSVKFVKKGWIESQEDFDDRIKREYADFVSNYLDEGGTFSYVFQAIMETSIGEDQKTVLEDKRDHLINSISLFLNLDKQKPEMPVPDKNYFLNLIQAYQKSDKSDKATIEIAIKYKDGLNEIIRQAYYFYDKYSGAI